MWKGIFVAALTVYLTYFVLSWNQPTEDLHFLGQAAPSLVLRRLLMPVWLYLRGLALFAVGAASRPTFLLGHAYPHGVWFYFPVVFVFKSTLAFLLMLVFGIPIALIARQKRQGRPIIPAQLNFQWRAVWMFLLVFTAFCMLSRLTISIRHFTVPIVLLILLLAPLPRALQQLKGEGWRPARLAMGVYFALAILSIAAVTGTYPYYFPFINSLGSGHLAYRLVNDSNVDWNQALPDVNRFAQQHGLSRVLVDEYGFTEPTVYIPQAELWDCQSPAPSDANQWAVVSAGMIEDGANCVWLLNFPHQPLAAGSMFAFQLPAVIPQVGDPGGPPPLSARRNWGGVPFDLRALMERCIRDPQQLQPVYDHFISEYQEQQKRSQAEHKKH